MKTLDVEHSIEVMRFGPVSKDAMADVTSNAITLQDAKDFREEPSGESLVAADDYSIAWLPAKQTGKAEEAMAASAEEAVSQLSLCCGYAYIPCCWGRILVRICLPRPWVWYRICYRCRYGPYICYHCIWVLCRRWW